MKHVILNKLYFLKADIYLPTEYLLNINSFSLALLLYINCYLKLWHLYQINLHIPRINSQLQLRKYKLELIFRGYAKTIFMKSFFSP